MIRSFDYAAFAALFAHAGDRPTSSIGSPRSRSSGGRGSAGIPRLTSAKPGGRRGRPVHPARSGSAGSTLLEAQLLDKALYELLYELNNRPDWVRIPLQGINALPVDPPQSPSRRKKPPCPRPNPCPA